MSKNLAAYEEWIEKLTNDPVARKKFLRSVMGPQYRTLEGKERDDILLLLKMVEPYSTHNNQHSCTSCYMIGNNDYHVTFFSGEDDIVELLLPEDNYEIN